MAITLNGTTGITNDGAYTGDGVVFADGTPANTLVTTTAGNVGIGTSVPTAKLDVVGNIILRGGGGEGGEVVLFNAAGSSAGAFIDVDGSNFLRLFNAQNTPTIFFTNSVERMRINELGNVGIGTTAPTAKLEVIGNSLVRSGTGIFRRNGGGSFGQAQIVAETDGATDSVFIALHVAGAAAPQLRAERGAGETIDCVSSNNNSFGVFRAGAFTVSSDYRIKENVTSISNALQRLTLLKPKQFSFTQDSMMYRDGVIVDGFLAHEVMPVVPEAVTGTKDELKQDGTPNYQSLDQSKLVPLLTAALQELSAKVDTLQAELNTLKGN